MFDPDLDKFKRKYDTGFDFGAIVRELLKPAEDEDKKPKKRKRHEVQKASKV